MLGARVCMKSVTPQTKRRDAAVPFWGPTTYAHNQFGLVTHATSSVFQVDQPLPYHALQPKGRVPNAPKVFWAPYMYGTPFDVPRHV